jgi:VWFA-related protein
MSPRIKVGLCTLALLLVVIRGSQHLGLHEHVAFAQQSGNGPGVTVPDRPASSLYKGEQGTQRSGITFAPVTRTVTIKLQVEDPNGYFMPNIRRDNFAVYEDGVRQKLSTVEVEHAPVSAALLMEYGGRYHELNKALGFEVTQIGRQLLEVIGRDDKVAIFTYGDKMETLADFTQGHDTLEGIFDRFSTPPFSELNLYDAVMETLNRVRAVDGRKAIILVSSGIDTFSKASFEQVLQAAKESSIPIYTVSLVHLMQHEVAMYGPTAPFARIDWNTSERQLEMLAKASGGRAYLLSSDLEIPAIYDDIMENLRLRYVITYVSSNPATSGPARNIRVELIDPKTGEALKIHDASGKLIASRIFVQETYMPRPSSGS